MVAISDEKVGCEAARLSRKWAALFLFVLFLGLVSLAAVGETTIACRSEPQYLTLQGGGYLLLQGGGRLQLYGDRQQCELDMAGVRVPLPAWA